MYKITNNIQQLTALNEAVKIIENNIDSQYCRIDYNADKTFIAIQITDCLRNNIQLKQICTFLTDDWFLDICKKPDNWSWHFNTAFRIIIPNYLILKETPLKALIQYVDAYNISNYVSIENTFIYVDEIYPEHKAILDLYTEIKIETL